MISKDILLQFRTGDTEGCWKSFWPFSYCRLQKQTMSDKVWTALLWFMAGVPHFFSFVRNFFRVKIKPICIPFRAQEQ